MTAPSEPSVHDHYENFPVASWLCPPALRPPIAAIYAFARVADDIADEGDAPAAERLDDLTQYRRDLDAAARGEPSLRWPAVFAPLALSIRDHRLPVPLLADLLDAFAQDVRKTAAGEGYATRTELLDYCRRSANPVGRLLLHLYGIEDAADLSRSDAICTALQLVNFWQDLSVDIPRGRYYLPQDDLSRLRIDAQALREGRDSPVLRALVQEQVQWARSLMRAGAPLALRVPGRAGWELRLVVQGGLRIADRIESIGFDSLRQRPTLGKRDLPVMLWRALCMRPPAPARVSTPAA